MTQQTMYPALANSPGTELSAAITDTDTAITVVNGAVLPDAPSIVTLGTDETAETVLYTGKSGNNLTGITRGFGGTAAKSWAVGTQVARYFTAYDHEAFRANITDHESRLGAAETAIINAPYNLYRQALINGNFDVWQRGTSFSADPALGIYTADRWGNNVNSGGGTMPTSIVRSRQTVTPGELDGSAFYYRISPSDAGSEYGANAEYSLRQQIENGTRLLAGEGKKITVSFWARSSIANKKIGARLFQLYGTGGSAAEIINGAHWTLSPTWTKYTHTFTPTTLAGKTFGADGNDSMGLDLYVMWGTDFSVGVGDTVAETFRGAGNIDIAQVQVCAGDAALPFQPRGYAEELRLCQRYFDQLALFFYDQIGTGISAASNTVFINFPVSVRPRANPTYTFTGNFSLTVGATEYTIQAADVTVTSASTRGGAIQISGSGMPTIGAGLPVKLRANLESYAVMDAEI